MLKLKAAQTIRGTRFGEGAVINSDAATESELVAAGVGEIMPIINTYTWATKPIYATTTVGTVINISDVGGTGGSFWKATAAGWVPLAGSITLYSAYGSRVSPIATLNTAAALFVPTGGAGSLVIPATALIPGRSKLRIDAIMERTGANATGAFSIYLGTGGNTTDSLVFQTVTAMTTLVGPRPAVDVFIQATGGITTTSYVLPGATTTADAFRDLTSQINTQSAMTVSFGISAASALDTFRLIGVTVELVSI